MRLLRLILLLGTLMAMPVAVLSSETTVTKEDLVQVKIEKSVLTGLGVRGDRADKFLPDLNEDLARYNINTPKRIAHFLAQVVYESGYFRRMEENLNYSADRLHIVFRKYFKTKQAAQPYHRNPRMIANRVYASRMGNGNPTSGDGYKFRGRGLIQLTGKENYETFAEWVGDPSILEFPDLVATKYPVTSAVYYWSTRNLNSYADANDVRSVTRRIDGGTNGLSKRRELTKKALQLLT